MFHGMMSGHEQLLKEQEGVRFEITEQGTTDLDFQTNLLLKNSEE